MPAALVGLCEASRLGYDSSGNANRCIARPVPFSSLMDDDVVIQLDESVDMNLDMLVSRVWLSRGGPDMIFVSRRGELSSRTALDHCSAGGCDRGWAPEHPREPNPVGAA